MMWARAAGVGEAENLIVIELDVETRSDGAQQVFPANWLSRNEACLMEGFCYNVSQV